jgi:predicted transcriptional regulator of viral defense system
MPIEDRLLIDLHRAAALAGRPGIVVPSLDLETTSQQLSNQRARDALKRLVRSGRALRVRQNLLVLPDATGRVTPGLPELIDVAAPRPHLITGARALEVNRLTNQHSFSVIVLVPHSITNFAFRGETTMFLVTQPIRIWGWQESGPRYAVPERAILDAVRSSRYGVSLPMAVRALRTAATRDRKFLRRLADAARQYESPTLARRLGLLVERNFGVEMSAPFHELIGESRTPVLLRSGGPAVGAVDPTWRVIINASTEPDGLMT